jgi:uncharacterized protein YjbK
MKTNLEIEYKALINEQEYKYVLSHFNPSVRINQTNHYYQSYNVFNRKIAARIRQIDDRFELTFKLRQAKGKLEVNFDVPSNSVEHFNLPEVQTFLKEHHFFQIWNYIGELHTLRYVVQDNYGELCIDHNTYLDQEDYELEYEVNTEYNPLAFSRFVEILNQFSIKNEKAKAKFHRFILAKSNQDLYIDN